MKLLLICFCLIVSIAESRKLPSYIHVCKPKHEDVAECIKKNIEILRPKLRYGIPELLIPPFDPFYVSATEVKLGESIKVNVKNIKIIVAKGFLVEDLKVDLSKLRLEFKVKMPEVKTQADYRVNGRWLVLNLDGSGVGKINLYNLGATIIAQGKKEEKNGKEYLVPTSIDVKPELEHMDIHLDNLFPSNPEMTDQANKLFNENQKMLFEDFGPLVVNMIKRMISNYITNFFSKFAYDDLFPDD